MCSSDLSRIKDLKPVMGDYFVCIAQNRVEKGFQHLKAILAHCDEKIKVIAAYNNIEQAEVAVKKYGFRQLMDSGKLEIRQDLKWETGLAELVAKSRGVIIPSIWPSTTEYGLLESLGFKKPVFCFDLGVHHEVIRNGVNGFVVPLGDYEAMAKYLMQIKSNDHIYFDVSENAGLLYKELTDRKRWISDLKLMGL